MLAFHNDPAIKQTYLDRVVSHRKADEIEKGYYWEKGKGCAVGCTIHGNDHSKYEIELGIPRILARLEDAIFENLPNERSKVWPEEFLSAINIGSNLESVWPKFAVWLLTDEIHGVLQFTKNEKIKNAIITVSEYYKNYKQITCEQWRNAAAARASYAADVYAADVYAAAAAADADDADADADDAATETRKNIKENCRIAQADKLLELLRECK